MDTTEIWIIPVANPDGYQYTFTNERLWRKNLQDNDGDGQITLADGVDLNRNFGAHWGYDNEGSSPGWPDATYRGAAPFSEPETRVMVDFIRQHVFKFLVSYHTFGDLILYPWGWQVKTPSLDDPIFVAQAGTDSNPAIFDTAGIAMDTQLPFGVRGAVGDPILDGVTFALQGGDGANNQCCASSFLPTSYFLPHFDQTVAARYDRPAGPLTPIRAPIILIARLLIAPISAWGEPLRCPRVHLTSNSGSPTIPNWIGIMPLSKSVR